MYFVYSGETNSEARLLMAQVQLHLGNYKQAQQSLEMVLSYNFEVVYLLISICILTFVSKFCIRILLDDYVYFLCFDYLYMIFCILDTEDQQMLIVLCSFFTAFP